MTMPDLDEREEPSADDLEEECAWDSDRGLHEWDDDADEAAIGGYAPI